MIQVVLLIPDEDIFAQVLDKPLVVLHSGKLVLRSNEQGRGDADMLKRHLRWAYLPVLLHVKDRTVIVATPDVWVLSALHVEYRVFVATSSWIVLQKDCQAAHIVDLVVSARYSVE